ncbi:MAG: 3'-5' exonuclease [archaeon]
MNLKPVALDLEMSGLDMEKCGVWQIGAVDLDTGEEFLEESRIDDEDEVNEESMRVSMKTEEELRDPSKQSQEEMIRKFFAWMEKRRARNFLAQNPAFDMGFLYIKASKYNLRKPFHFRSFDLHTIAQVIFYKLNNKFFTRENDSDMSLTNILEFCGIPDGRVQLVRGKVAKEGKPHNALEDAKLAAECFCRLMKGENLFPEYSQYAIPEVLKNAS